MANDVQDLEADLPLVAIPAQAKGSPLDLPPVVAAAAYAALAAIHHDR